MTKTYVVRFISCIAGNVFRTGEYRTKRAIYRWRDRYELQYGASLSLRVLDKATMAEVQLHEVA